MAKTGSAARKAAADAMTSVTEGGHLLREVLPHLTADLDPGNRARAGRLATGALRWAGRSDRVLGPHLRLRPEDAVLNLLRLALFEIFVDGAPEHAAVDGAVSLATRSKSGLVNAVLRNVIRRKPIWDEVALPSLPKWLRKPLVKAWGKEAVAAMEVIFAADPPLDLTLRDPSQAAEWAETLAAEVRPDGGLRLKMAGQVSALPGFEDGAWWVQDAGATVAARVLDARPGERVLDLCAAPGGKLMQLAATGATVTALDISKERMERVEENLSRTKLRAEILVSDALKWHPDTPFDAILLDAPCSATGTLRRHPDLGYARDGNGIADLVALQSRLLDRALDWLKPGGRLVYCTCSLLPEEGEGQLAAALDRHAGLSVAETHADWVEPDWSRHGRGLRILPNHWADIGGIDGFFVARLEKRS